MVAQHLLGVISKAMDGIKKNSFFLEGAFLFVNKFYSLNYYNIWQKNKNDSIFRFVF